MVLNKYKQSINNYIAYKETYIMRINKLKKTFLALPAFIVTAALTMSFSCHADEKMNTITGPLDTVLPADTQLFVTVEGKGLRAKVSAYKRECDEAGQLKDSFELVFATDEAYLGRQGLGKTKEGDDKTPIGLFKMNTPFGIKDKEEGFPDNYLKLDERYYWDGDSESDRYNELVNIDEYQDFDKSKSEHLIDVTTCYDYAIDTGYNIEGTPYKGSALFLHCERGINTAGCIAIKEEYMKEVLRLYEEGKSYIKVVNAEE